MTAGKSLVQFDDVSFSYDGQQDTLCGVSFSIEEGSFVGMIGPNGGGKSTILKLILGLLFPSRGSIRIAGRPIDNVNTRSIGYVPQYSTFARTFPITVVDAVALGTLGLSKSMWGGISRSERADAMSALAALGIEELATRPIGSLSGGQMQKVLIARALVSKPKLLLLDEPTASIDPHGEDDIFKMLESFRKELTILVVSHDLGFVSSHVTHVACVNRHLDWHTPASLNADALSKLYGGNINAVLHNHEHGKGHHHHNHEHNH
jgi:zinc transport system ATP-binding protein